MGTFTDNLLKLTDFPFSYSFIGLLALIFGAGLNPADPLFFNKLGPLLILMGFVATTLSISDPLGRLQKALLVTGDGFKVERPLNLAPTIEIKKSAFDPDLQNKAKELEEQSIKTSQNLYSEWDKLRSASIANALFHHTAIFGPPFRDLSLQRIIPNHVIICLISDFESYRNNNVVTNSLFDLPPIRALEEIQYYILEKLAIKIVSLKRKAVGTTWVTREIDKITSMAYFIIVVATFTYAVIFIPSVVVKFVDTFQGIESVQNEQTQDSEDVAVRNEDILPSKIIIGAFSIVALGAVLTILIKRARELRSKCLTTFRFLVLQNAIKIKRDTFERRLEEIRQFLVDGDWTLAEVEVDRLMEEYNDLAKKEWVPVAEEKEINSEEIMSKDTEKKIMITWKNGEMREDIEKKIMIKWKNGEMSVEEVKDVEEKVSSEEIKNPEP